MANPENLKPFEKGNVIGKLGGRPKGKSLTTLLKEAADSDYDVVKNGKKETRLAKEWLVASMFRDAIHKGDNTARAQIWDRLEGKPVQRVETTGSEGGPIQIGFAPLRERNDDIIAKITSDDDA